MPAGPSGSDLNDAIWRLGDVAIELTSRLVRIPSDAPTHDESAVVAAIQTAATELDLPAGEVIAAEAGRQNLVIRIAGSSAGRRLFFNAHTDTKPPGPRREWHGDPRSGVVRNGRLHGLGAADAKSSVAAMLVAAAALRAVALPAGGELVLIFSADEEAAGTLGLGHVLASMELTGDGAIIGEPVGVSDGFDTLPIGSRGFVGFEIRADGRQIHSGFAGQTGAQPEAITMLARAIDRLPRIVEFGLVPTDGFPLGPSLAFTGLTAGVASGILPPHAVARGEVRTVPGQSQESTLAALNEALQRLQTDEGLSSSLCIVADPEIWPAATLDPTHPIIRALRDAAEAVLHRRPRVGIFPGATEAHFFTRRGIPCVPGFGPGRLAAAHVPGESVATDEILAAVAIYARGAAAFLT